MSLAHLSKTKYTSANSEICGNSDTEYLKIERLGTFEYVVLYIFKMKCKFQSVVTNRI